MGTRHQWRELEEKSGGTGPTELMAAIESVERLSQRVRPPNEF